ncbi:hypothetical protein S40285_10367 [Stachybotrys chlorohalonatus IBT 40285]|uniref:Uncharacterized protein n=1 Tax=Stachybotrys chlorohalonatus (strain IBT 40285) TaxID=1283841 RepID=A0A084QNY6_STAC4|nr:hypothetical protein S40285_10367 [Stachybotrys chlorohalonata IBT 40285]
MPPGPATALPKRRFGVLAVAASAVIFVGALTGAQLKNDSQKAEAVEQFRKAPAAEQIAALEAQKKVLLQQRATVQKRLDLFHERIEERRQELAQKAKLEERRQQLLLAKDK